MIDASVSPVRRLLAAQVRPEQWQVLEHGELRRSSGSGHSFAFELALLEMQHVLRARRGVRIVRHHDDRLALLLVQRLQQVEDLIARLAVEIAGRLVAQQERGIGDDRARDADALLLTARQLARLVLRAITQADEARARRRRACVGPRRTAK